MDVLAGFFVLGVLLFLYFLPWVVAKSRGHHNSLAIFWLTFFTGWTALGFVIALVWACTQVRPPQISVPA